MDMEEYSKEIENQVKELKKYIENTLNDMGSLGKRKIKEYVERVYHLIIPLFRKINPNEKMVRISIDYRKKESKELKEELERLIQNLNNGASSETLKEILKVYLEINRNFDSSIKESVLDLENGTIFWA